MEADKTAGKAEIAKNIEVPSEPVSGEGVPGFLFPLVIAITLLFLDVFISLFYYRNQDVFDLRWFLAMLDICVILMAYAVTGRKLSRLLVSMNLALGLLLVIGILAIVGTFLPQGEAAIESGFINNPMYDIYKDLGLLDMYYSRWFLALLFLLLTNLSVCIIKRLPTSVRRALRPRVDVKDIYITNQPLTERMGGGEKALTAATGLLKNHRFRLRTGDSGSVLAERGRYSGLFSISFHLSFLFLLAGFILVGILGYSSQLQIPDGATVAVPETDLKVKNHHFEIEYTEVRDGDRVTGYRPAEFSSDLEIFREGESLKREVITVNSPMRFEGVNFHQASYFQSGQGLVTVVEVNKSPGKSLVYIGFMLMMGGVTLGLFFPHRRIWLKVGESGELLIGGRTNRAMMSFQREFERLASELRMTLGQEAGVDG